MSELEIYTAWANVPEHLKTKTQLGKEGLRPAKEQKPVAKFCSYYYGKSRPRFYYLYDVNEAIPKRTATPAQLEALKKARAEWKRKCVCQRCGLVASRPLPNFPHCRRCIDRLKAETWAREVLSDEQTIILDTETTDLDGEPVEIAIINTDGKPLLNTLVQATEPVSPEARRVHGITDEELKDAPTFSEVYPDLCRILEAASRIVIYNAAFDFDILERARKIHNLPFYPVARIDTAKYTENGQSHKIETCRWWNGLNCAMEAYAQWYGEWSNYHDSYKWQPLNGNHRALGDCLACLDVLREMATESEEAIE